MECCESTRIPVSLDAWMELTATPSETRAEIVRLMEQDIGGGARTGFNPYLKDGRIFFDQRWCLWIGVKPAR